MATLTHHTPTTDVELQEEQPKMVEVPPEPSVGATEKPGGHLKVLPDKETKVEVEGIEGAEAVSEEVEIPVDVPEVEARYGGQSEKVEKLGEVVSAVDVKEKVLSEEVEEPKKSVEGKHVEDKGASADKFDDSTLLKEEKTCKEEEPSTSSEGGSITTQETRTDHQEEVDGKAPVPEVVEEKAGSRDESKESSVAVFTDINIDIVVEEKAGSRDERTEKMKENIAKEVEVEAKQVEATIDVNEPVKEPEESGLEVKERENVETSVDKLEEEKAEEISKSDVQNQELTSQKGDETETNTSKDLPKEVLAKPTHKQSNNIISKVKKLLVQAKKAIIGKSPSSKTFSSGTKGDIKVK